MLQSYTFFSSYASFVAKNFDYVAIGRDFEKNHITMGRPKAILIGAYVLYMCYMCAIYLLSL